MTNPIQPISVIRTVTKQLKAIYMPLARKMRVRHERYLK